jgi:hypothetical protein
VRAYGWEKHTERQVRAATGVLNGIGVAVPIMMVYNPELGRDPGSPELMFLPPLGGSSCQCCQALSMLIHNSTLIQDVLTWLSRPYSEIIE